MKSKTKFQACQGTTVLDQIRYMSKKGLCPKKIVYNLKKLMPKHKIPDTKVSFFRNILNLFFTLDACAPVYQSMRKTS